ncbi:MAG: DUF2764 family protein [Candidatus Omnitrophica bacterium]|nr:DUF2764 family protein [Candidatus Omnitrophota bacterium]
MSSYYYLIAQMPQLNFGQQPRVTSVFFLQEAKKWLSEKEYAILSGVSLNNFVVNEQERGVLLEYKTFEYNLRKEIVSLRKQKETTKENPLETEKKLLLRRWQFLENISAMHNFDTEFIIAYFLKIQVLERLFTFNKEKGLMVFDALCEIKL